jgi:hypothetical protein
MQKKDMLFSDVEDMLFSDVAEDEANRKYEEKDSDYLYLEKETSARFSREDDTISGDTDTSFSSNDSSVVT